MQSRRWVFTLNNPSQEEQDKIVEYATNCKYLIYGREQGASGTPHLQGFLINTSPTRRSAISAATTTRMHLEKARGTSVQARDYCKKDGDYEEFGSFPENHGKRTDIERFKQYVEEAEFSPSVRDIARNFPALYARSGRRLLELVEHLRPLPVLLSGDLELREWQQHLHDTLIEDPDDRSVYFTVNPDGNSGKSWFISYMLTKYPDKVQSFRIGKRDDIAHVIDKTKSIFLFDIPRKSMEFLQYSILEQLKDRIVFSPKYESCNKIIAHNTHVAVFCNEHPDMEALSADRYIINII